MDTKIVNKLPEEILLVSTKAIVFYRVCTNLKMEIIKIFDFPTIARRLLKLYTSNLVKVTAWNQQVYLQKKVSQLILFYHLK